MTHQKIEFIRNFKSNLGEFEIDETYVHSAMINIIDNAIDACARDTSKKFHKIVFDVWQSKEHVEFDVFDDGIGMDQETQEKLFTPFFSSKGDKGTGLGLFISNAIIQEHCGEIKVKSTVGQGTLVQIKIPRKAPIKRKEAS